MDEPTEAVTEEELAAVYLSGALETADDVGGRRHGAHRRGRAVGEGGGTDATP